MMRKLFFWLLAGILLAGLTSGAHAAGPFGGRPPSPEKMFAKIAQDLGLTKEQKEKFQAAAKKVEADTQALNAKNRKLFAEIEKEMVKDDPNSTAIHDHMQQISRNQTESQFKRMDQMLRLRKELTPEQKAKFEKMVQKGKEHFKTMSDKMKHKGGKDKGPVGPEGSFGPGGPEGPDGPDGPGGPGGPGGE